MKPSPEADTLLLTVPNQLGVEYNAHVIEAILAHVAPALGGAETGRPCSLAWINVGQVHHVRWPT